MKVFLTGSTGFVGEHVLEKLLEENHDVTLLVRPGSEKKLDKEKLEKCEVVNGDINTKQSVLKGCEDADAVINLIGIIREFPQKGITFDKVHSEGTFSLVMAAQQKDVDEFLQMSALGTRKNAKSKYHRSKFQGEVFVKESGLDYTIFRPSIIFGEGDESISMIEDYLEDHKIFPLIGLGKYQWQPIHVEDVAEYIVSKLGNSENETIEMGGPEVYEFREIIDLISQAKNNSVIKIPIPSFFIKIPTVFLQYQRWYPLSLEMMKMLKEDNVVKGENFKEELKSLKEHINQR